MIGPDEQVRLAFVAEEYYLRGRSKIELATELGVSRFKVARMLDDAASQGIVHIEIRAPGPVDAELSLRLQKSYGLRRAVVVATATDDPAVVQQSLGLVAARLAAEIVADGDVLGVTAGRTLTAMARRLTSIAPCDVVQLAGIAGPIESTGIDIVRRISLLSGGSAFSIYAPLVVSDQETARAMRSQPELQRTLAQIDRVTVAFVAIGSWQPPDSELHDSEAIPAEVRARLVARGVVAEIGGTTFDASGAVIDDLEPYCLAATGEQLSAIPDVVGVAGGSRKTGAVRAALRSGLVGSLVTDVDVARELIS
jgi:DNA-binding transcriptional regulator LsrR (DeoR family)